MLTRYISSNRQVISKKLGLKRILLISFQFTSRIPIHGQTTTNQAAFTTRRCKNQDFQYLVWQNDAILTIASRGVCRCKMYKESVSFHWLWFWVSQAERFLYGNLWDHMPEHGVLWGYGYPNMKTQEQWTRRTRTQWTRRTRRMPVLRRVGWGWGGGGVCGGGAITSWLGTKRYERRRKPAG